MTYSIRPMEIQISIRALRTASIYLIDNGYRKILIDTGMDENIDTFLEKNEVEVNQIDMVLLTHMHIDHIGGAHKLKEKFGIDSYIGKNDLKRIELLQDSPERYISWQLDYLKRNGVPDKFLQNIGENQPIFRELNNYMSLNLSQIEAIEPMLKDIKFLSVPGHSPGSTCFSIPEQKVIFTGDHILQRITPNISYYDETEDMLGEYLVSLKGLLADQSMVAYPGHGVSFDNLSIRIQELLKHHEERMSEIKGIVQDVWMCSYDVARKMHWSKGRTMDSMNMMESNFAIGEAISHLRHMEVVGLISKKEINGIYYYKNND
jgi:glyoxylase-like metal-dependent hydrolase (beta-lactamase superfamily II)